MTRAATSLPNVGYRSWTLLPDNIRMARLRVPAGTHQVSVELMSDAGLVGDTATFGEVVVLPGEATIIRLRSFR